MTSVRIVVIRNTGVIPSARYIEAGIPTPRPINKITTKKVILFTVFPELTLYSISKRSLMDIRTLKELKNLSFIISRVNKNVTAVTITLKRAEIQLIFSLSLNIRYDQLANGILSRMV